MTSKKRSPPLNRAARILAISQQTGKEREKRKEVPSFQGQDRNGKESNDNIHGGVQVTPAKQTSIGTVNSTSYVFRDMFVNHLYSSDDATIKESQRFAACHSEAVTERNYVSELVRETKILTGLLAYRDAIEGLKDNNNFVTTDTVDQREYDANIQMKQDRKDNMLKTQRRKDESEKISRNRITNDATKASFLQAIILERRHSNPVSKEGRLVDVFLRFPMAKKELGRRVVCRMIDILPQEWPCVQYLKQHLHDFMKIMEVNGTGVKWERQVEADWTHTLINQFKNMAKTGTQNIRILHILATLAIQLAEEGKEDPFVYCLKSPKLTKQVSSHMQTWEDHQEVEEDNLLGMADSLKPKDQTTISPKFESGLNGTTNEIFQTEEVLTEKEPKEDMEDFEVLHDQAESCTYSNYNIVEVEGRADVLLVPPGTPLKRTPVKKRRREEELKKSDRRYQNSALRMTGVEKLQLLERCIEKMENPAGPKHSAEKDQLYLVWREFYSGEREKGGRSYQGLLGNWFGLGKFKEGVQQAIFEALKVDTDSRPDGKTVREKKKVIVEFYRKKSLGIDQ